MLWAHVDGTQAPRHRQGLRRPIDTLARVRFRG